MGEKRRSKTWDAEANARYSKLLEKHASNGVKLPPNATYQHTVMRVLSMSEKRLETRVRVIERAQGNYAVIKMRMFAEVTWQHARDTAAFIVRCPRTCGQRRPD